MRLKRAEVSCSRVLKYDERKTEHISRLFGTLSFCFHGHVAFLALLYVITRKNVIVTLSFKGAIYWRKECYLLH